MNSIQNQSGAAGMLQKAQVASYMRKQSVSAYQSLNAGLTIQTRDGDLVTLTSSSYAQLDAFMYDSKGILQTGDGMAVASQSHREITLASGDSFTFSVIGDLSEAELEDIEKIVKEIDAIVAEMAEGDMDEAVEKAMAMGAYDTVSMYAADISYERSYRQTTETRAWTEAIDAEPEAELLPRDESPAMTAIEPYPENHAPKKEKKNSIKDINQFVEKMLAQLDTHEDKQVARSKNAVDKLFDHYLDKENSGQEGQTPAFSAIESAKKQIGSFIDNIAGRLFENQLSSLF